MMKIHVCLQELQSLLKNDVLIESNSIVRKSSAREKRKVCSESSRKTMLKPDHSINDFVNHNDEVNTLNCIKTEKDVEIVDEEINLDSVESSNVNNIDKTTRKTKSSVRGNFLFQILFLYLISINYSFSFVEVSTTSLLQTLQRIFWRRSNSKISYETQVWFTRQSMQTLRHEICIKVLFGQTRGCLSQEKKKKFTLQRL